MKTEWVVEEVESKKIEDLSKSLNVSYIISKLLILRGITNYDEAKLFFRPKINDIHDPFLMKDMRLAIDRINSAISKNEKILIYGDYDVDGTTSVAMLVLFLRNQHDFIDWYIPCRYNEGYGLSLKGIDYAKSKDVKLIITLDCGINAVQQVQYANKHEIDVIICDHHNPSAVLPNATAILNPKQKKCTYPYKELSGCGVGFKLIHAFSINKNISFDEIAKYLEFVAISIVADIVPLNDENRILAFYGLQKINQSPSIGVKALSSSFKNTTLSTSDLIFGIAPRINAAGRIFHARKAVELLIEKDINDAKRLTVLIEKHNNERKEIEQKIFNEAIKKIDDSKKTIVLYSQNWHKGVVGIVASKIVEKYYKPTIIFSEKEGVLTGSARSVKEYNIYEKMKKCSDLFESFGGHKYAAGLSILKVNINKFIDKFEEIVSESISLEHLTPKIKIDEIIKLSDINNKLYRIINQFEPFGPLNRKPVFVSKVDSLKSRINKIGKNKEHLKIYLEEVNLNALAFFKADMYEKIKNSENYQICYTIDQNIWNGNIRLQLIIQDIKL